MYKFLWIALCIISLISCATVSNQQNQVQLISSDSTLINGCKKLGPVNVDTQAINFNEKAISEFKKLAYDKYGADSAVITQRNNKAFGHVVIEGTALKCYS